MARETTKRQGILATVPLDQAGAEPRIVTEFDGLPVRAGLGDLIYDAWGTQKAVSDVSLFHGMFTYDVPPSMWIFYENGFEVKPADAIRATSIDGYCNLTSGPTVGNRARLGTRRHPRYQPNRGIHWAGSLGMPDFDKDGIVKFGLGGDLENGMYFKAIGNGKLYACISSIGIETHCEEISVPFDIDFKAGNLFDIVSQWRGVGNIRYYISCPKTALLTKVHEIKLLGTLKDKLSVANPAMSLFMYAENVTEEVRLWCGCMDLSSEGGLILERFQFGEYGVTGKLVSAGDGIFAIRQPSTINSAINTRDIKIKRMAVTSDKRATVKVYGTRDSLAVIGTGWTTTRAGSFVEASDNITAVNTSLMEPIASFRLHPNETQVWTIPSNVDLFAVHGEYIPFILESGANPTIDAEIDWGEEI